MNSLPYDAVVFDLDGTIFNSEQGIVSSALWALEQLGVTPPEGMDMRAIIGPPLRDSFRELIGLTEEQTEEALTLYRRHFGETGMYLYTVYPHIRTLLTMLRQAGAYVAMATSKPLAITEKILRHYGLYHYFDRVSGVREDERSASKRELISRALPERFTRAAMVGDRRFDVEGAAQAGIDSVGAGYGFGSEEELSAAGATHIVPDTESLVTLLCPGEPIPRGFFLSVEGLDGSGKTTQIDLLEKSLRDYGYSVLRTREPGGCDISEDVRQIILDTANIEMCPACEALLYAASRAQHVHQVIRPAVERGMLVLCDRFVDSSIAYQGGGRELGVETVAQLNEPAVAGLLPDATLYLSIDPLKALERRHNASAPDRLEMEAAPFYDRVSKAYERIIHDNRRRFMIVDADKDVPTVARDALRAVLGRLEPELEA